MVCRRVSSKRRDAPGAEKSTRAPKASLIPLGEKKRVGEMYGVLFDARTR